APKTAVSQRSRISMVNDETETPFSLDEETITIVPQLPEDEDTRRSTVSQKLTDFIHDLKVESNISHTLVYQLKNLKNFTATVLYLDDYDIVIDGIKITRMYVYASDLSYAYEYAFYLPEMELFAGSLDMVGDLVPRIHRIVHQLKGNEVEYRQSRSGNLQSNSSEFWTTWNQTEPHLIQQYRDVIDTNVARAVRAVLKDDAGPNPGVLELFSYDAPMTEMLMAERDKHADDETVRHAVMDRDKAAMERARQKFIGKPVGVYERDISQVVDFRQEIGFVPHVITSVGGLNSYVVTREEALPVAQRVFQALPEGGYFIVSGITLCHLNSDDFRGMGFEVLNYSIPQRFSNIARGQFYILRKPGQDYSQKVSRVSGRLAKLAGQIQSETFMDPVAITGETGFLGGSVSRLFSGRASDVSSLTRDVHSPDLSPAFTPIEGNLMDIGSLKRLLRGRKVFINIAADSSTGIKKDNREGTAKILMTNVLGPALSLLTADQENKSMRKIYISSFDVSKFSTEADEWLNSAADRIAEFTDAVFKSPEKMSGAKDFFEGIALEYSATEFQVSAYGLSKALMEKVLMQLVRRYRIQGVMMLRIMNLIGSEMLKSSNRGSVIRMIQAVLYPKPLPVGQMVTPYRGVSDYLISADDVARALFELVKIPISESLTQIPVILELAGEKILWEEVVETIGQTAISLGVPAETAYQNIMPVDPPNNFVPVKEPDRDIFSRLIGYGFQISNIRAVLAEMTRKEYEKLHPESIQAPATVPVAADHLKQHPWLDGRHDLQDVLEHHTSEEVLKIIESFLASPDLDGYSRLMYLAGIIQRLPVTVRPANLVISALIRRSS
ncbi:MAG: NAD(P)-dependent oxidoreductase, partial [Candidatus Aureabacteria bacterium]|nr:NAD(P)-dependent oxidoreductase [Candidatus Auribacterota bacterium]